MASSSTSKAKYSELNQNESLGASLVAPDPQDVANPTTAAPMIEIVAPATLIEGYELETQVGDSVMKVKIPPGGVEKGQKFAVPMPMAAVASSTNNKQQRVQVPVGQWKDGMCDCCQHGCCHPSCWMGFGGLICCRITCACCWCLTCPALGAAQVATRLGLNWFGQPTEDNTARRGRPSPFSRFAMISAIFVTTQLILFLIMVAIIAAAEDKLDQEEYDDPYSSYSSSSSSTTKFGTSNQQSGSSYSQYHPAKAHDTDLNHLPPAVQALALVWRLSCYAYFILCVLLIRNVRSQVRKKYSIPENESCPTGCEDCYTATCCPCCTSAQMMRHTGDYDHYPAQCCSSTGLPSWVDEMIV